MKLYCRIAAHWIVVVILILNCQPLARTEEPTSKTSRLPAYQRQLQGNDAAKGEELKAQIKIAESNDRYDDVIRLTEELLTLRTKVQGDDHWEVVTERWAVKTQRTISALTPEQRAEWRRILQGVDEAHQFEAKAQFAKSQPLLEAFVQRVEQIFGQEHYMTAFAYFDLAATLNELGSVTRPSTYTTKHSS